MSTKIVQIAPMFNPQENGKLAIYGLGEDGRVYFWSASEGVFKPNWMQQEERKVTKLPTPLNRNVRRAIKKARK